MDDKIHPRKWKFNPRDFKIICSHGGKTCYLSLFCSIDNSLMSHRAAHNSVLIKAGVSEEISTVLLRRYEVSSKETQPMNV